MNFLLYIQLLTSLRKSLIHLDAGIYFIDPQRPIQLKGVSLKGNYQHPSIITVLDKNTTGTIQGMFELQKKKKKKLLYFNPYDKLIQETMVGLFKISCLKMFMLKSTIKKV